MKVLFVCIENTCRSVMAETVFNSLAKSWKAESAGVEAGKEYDGKAVEILEKRGYRVNEGRPKSLKDVNLESYEVVIAVCGESACVNVPHRNVERWYVEDPKGKGVDEYLKTLSMIEDKVRELLRRLEDESS
ncbi:low molecular weight phosphatase family protein [Geoglobus acetivorans]|uniref:Low molecular weight phosphatase family protein n=1 Tax=Geoglobus acetivorans TaxID=565033 RepID=A0ABZ3H202_GEOAI|nr:low molecular weight phosphatase family protein [Geoglobus acetivorans]